MMIRPAVFAALLVFTATLVAQAPDRTRPPQVGPPPVVHLPTIQKRQLSNGLPVWLVELHEVPVAQVNLVVLRGSADDPAGKFGIATLTAAMLQEGAGARTSLELADAIDKLVAGFEHGDLDILSGGVFGDHPVQGRSRHERSAPERRDSTGCGKRPPAPAGDRTHNPGILDQLAAHPRVRGVRR